MKRFIHYMHEIVGKIYFHENRKPPQDIYPQILKHLFMTVGCLDLSQQLGMLYNIGY